MSETLFSRTTCIIVNTVTIPSFDLSVVLCYEYTVLFVKIDPRHMIFNDLLLSLRESS